MQYNEMQLIGQAYPGYAEDPNTAFPLGLNQWTGHYTGRLKTLTTQKHY